MIDMNTQEFANIPTDKTRKRIVIIGGGFAGLKLAKKIDKKRYQIVLIDKNNYYQFQPLLYQVASAGLEPSSISYPHRKYFWNNPNFIYCMTKAEKVLPEENLILTSIGKIAYDYLVVATGCDTNYFGNEETPKHSYALKSLSESILLRNRILLSFEQATRTNDPKELEKILSFVVVGAGATGVEIAGALADMRRKILPKDYPGVDFSKMTITLLDGAPRVLAALSEKSSFEAEKILTKRGVIVKCNSLVNGCTENGIELKDGTVIESQNIIWVTGVIANSINGLAEESYFRNRLLVDEINRVKSYDNIFAIGDTALMMKEKYPKGHPQVAQPALQMAVNLAKNLNSEKEGYVWRKFEYKDKGSMATIGKNAAVAEIGNMKFKGFFAWWIWLFIHIMSMIGMRNKVTIMVDWLWNYLNYDVSLRLFIRPKANDMYRNEE